MQLGLDIQSADWQDLAKDFNHLVPARSKDHVLKGLGRKFVSLNRQRIKGQKNTDGSSFKTKTKAPGQKALKKILRGKLVGIEQTGMEVIVFSKVPFATEHQVGATRTSSSKDVIAEKRARLKKNLRDYELGDRLGEASVNRFGSNQKDVPCSKEQAKILIKEVGFKRLTVPGDQGGSKRIRATISALQARFTMSEAGFIIKKARLAKGWRPKSSWSFKLPKREVLGLSRRDEQDLFFEFKRLIAHYAHFRYSMPAGSYAKWAEGYSTTH